MTASRCTVQIQDSRPTFTPGHRCSLRPLYDLAQAIARDLIHGDESDGDNYRPPTVPEHHLNEALGSGHVMIAAELLDGAAAECAPEAELAIFPATYMDAWCRTMVLISADRYEPEVDDSLGAFVDAQERYRRCPPDERPWYVAQLDQSEAQFDRLSWDALVRHDLALHPSLVYAFLTTDDPGSAVRV